MESFKKMVPQASLFNFLHCRGFWVIGLFYVRAKSKKIYWRNHGNKVLGLRIKKEFILKYA